MKNMDWSRPRTQRLVDRRGAISSKHIDLSADAFLATIDKRNDLSALQAKVQRKQMNQAYRKYRLDQAELGRKAPSYSVWLAQQPKSLA